MLPLQFLRRRRAAASVCACVISCTIWSVSVFWLTCRTSAAPPGLEPVSPAEVEMDAGRLAHIDTVVAEGLARQRMPGCVVLIGRRNRIVLEKAYGYRQLRPTRQVMTTDTVFDLASLTKPIATATSVMRLVEAGRIRLSDPVAKHIPEFAAQGKDKITILHLLTHQGGLIPDNAIGEYQQGPVQAMRNVMATQPIADPEERFVYTDVGFIVLAEMVRRLTGQNIHDYTQTTLFGPLGMTETGYLPPVALRRRAAPTEQRDERWIQGEVHDPRAYLLGGIAGHAGLFSTARDLAIYAQMMASGGSYHDVRILEPETVETMTRHVAVPGALRALGWDIRSGYSSNRGDLFSERAFGHGGFTGTVLWIDPELELFVIFLSNRVHPDGKGSINRLAGRIATLAGAAIFPARKPARPTTNP